MAPNGPYASSYLCPVYSHFLPQERVGLTCETLGHGQNDDMWLIRLSHKRPYSCFLSLSWVTMSQRSQMSRQIQSGPMEKASRSCPNHESEPSWKWILQPFLKLPQLMPCRADTKAPAKACLNFRFVSKINYHYHFKVLFWVVCYTAIDDQGRKVASQ